MPAGHEREFEQDIGSLTPTVCHLMGVPPPEVSEREPIEAVLHTCRAGGLSRIEKCLVYAPDAMGAALFRAFPDLITGILPAAPLQVGLRSVYPPKTPVCFASMFTGAPPAAHGIQAYERPVLECRTLFDALIASGKRPAIVSVADASADIIFRGRDMEYCSESGDGDVTDRALDIIEAGRHDFMLAYHQEYDDLLHETGPFAPAALAAARRHVEAFQDLAARARVAWAGRVGLVVFAPDHGAHVDLATGRGTHGDDMPDDMEVFHFFGVIR